MDKMNKNVPTHTKIGGGGRGGGGEEMEMLALVVSNPGVDSVPGRGASACLFCILT